MHGFALAVVVLVCSADPIELPNDTHEIGVKTFKMPIQVQPDRADDITAIRVFYSEDGGKTWKHYKDYKPTDTDVEFTAKRDGFVWFALQIQDKKAKNDPSELKDLTPVMKVYVNSEQRVVTVQKLPVKQLSKEDQPNEKQEVSGQWGMPGIAFALFLMMQCANVVEIPDRTLVVVDKEIKLPLALSDKSNGIATIRLFYSEDNGKTWTHYKDYKPNEQTLKFLAKHDGFVWFALQTKFKDGKTSPSEVKDLEPSVKLYVNFEKRVVGWRKD